MSGWRGQLRANSSGIAGLCRHIDASPFGRPVPFLEGMGFLSELSIVIPVAVEESAKVATTKRKRCEFQGFWSDLRDAPSCWVKSGQDDYERASRAEWSLEARQEVRRILPKAGISLGRTEPYEGDRRHEDLIDVYKSDRRSVWECIYYFGLDLNNAATHVLAVWLLGGHAVDWEGTFPDGRVVGYFFGGSPDVKD